MRWALLSGGVVATAALIFLLISGFGDVPCQDGQWSKAQQTCIPD
jgi:hypothetical protein